MREAYSGIGSIFWQEETIKKLLKIFPEGQLCILVNSELVASALALRVSYNKFGDNHTYAQIPGNYTFDTHKPDGDIVRY